MNWLSESVSQCPAQVHLSSVVVGPQREVNLDDSLKGSLCDTLLLQEAPDYSPHCRVSLSAVRGT